MNVDVLNFHCLQLDPTVNNAFTAKRLLFRKPEWIDDKDVAVCQKCGGKFSAVKRKHHCRQCGRIFCSQCCKQKMQLSHLGYSDQERVCEMCVPVVKIFYLAFSGDNGGQCEAAIALHDNCTEIENMKLLVQLGGIHVLIYLMKSNDIATKKTVIKALLKLSENAFTLQILVSSGAIKAVCSILSHTDDQDLQMSGLCLLTLLLKDKELKTAALEDGILVSIHYLVSSSNDTTCLLALRCLCLISENKDSHTPISECHERNMLAKLVALGSGSKNEQVQETALRVLCYISSGPDWNKQRIIQEDIYNGGHLCKILTQKLHNKQVLINTVCVIANIAANNNMQGSLREHVSGMCKIIQTHRDHEQLSAGISRALANFAKFQSNCDIILEHLPSVISICLMSPVDVVRINAFKIIISLMQYSPDNTVQSLKRSGSSEFLSALAGDKELLDLMYRHTATKTAESSGPPS